MKFRSIIAWTGCAFLTVLFFHNCSHAPIKHQSFPPLGEHVILPQIQPTTQSKADGEYKHVLIYFTMGSATLDYEDRAVVQMLDREDGAVLAEYTPQELRDMFHTTDCPQQVTAFLENAFVGDALFCNSSIDLSRVGEFRILREGRKDKTATSYIVEYARNELDMIALTVDAN
ncbi:MAG: hypothetical protein H6624_08835 [Bdellovibrionaceae bacterium]|nr:hypothetical protein [Bdellovibrionales bacterium]MCB9084438.1 hypothetical protein [Pseudobdellovibrionaceae bacterium]